MFIDKNEKYLKESLPKRLKLNDVVSNINDIALSYVKFTLELMWIGNIMNLQTWMLI